MAGTKVTSQESDRFLAAGGRSRSWTAPHGRSEVISAVSKSIAGTTEGTGGSEPGLAEQEDGRREEGQIMVRDEGRQTCRGLQSMVDPSNGKSRREPEAAGQSTTAHSDLTPKRGTSLHRDQSRDESRTFLSKIGRSKPSTSSSSRSGGEKPIRTSANDRRNLCQSSQQRVRSKPSRWGSLTEDALRQQQQQYFPGAQKTTEQVDPHSARAGGVHYSDDDSDICRQEPSPLSLPEGIGASSPRTPMRGKNGLDRNTSAGKESGERAGGSARGGDGGMSTSTRAKTNTGTALGFSGGPSPPGSKDGVPPLAADECLHGPTPNQKRSLETASLDRTKSRDTGRNSAMKVDMEAHNSNELSGQSGEAEASRQQQAKHTNQAKRLALEVARLRSSLRATSSELDAERSNRLRLEVRQTLHLLEGV